MSFVPFTDALRTEYENLFATCVPANVTAVDNVVNRIAANRDCYQRVGTALSIPWYFIGAIHHMESSSNFNTHLHNGDPLTARTVHEPPGRPVDGDPPFTWEQSALDALKHEGLDQVRDWTLPGLLYQMEKYNGFAYRTNHPEVLSPYLWSSSNNYTKGKYVTDHKFDPDAVSSQIGAAVVLRRMVESQVVQFDQQSAPVTRNNPDMSSIATLEPLVTYSSKVSSPEARNLQTALNQFPGIFLFVDGIPGPRTSDAVKTVTGHFLTGDPRAAANPV